MAGADRSALGLAAAVVGNTVIGAGQTMQKYAVNRAATAPRPRWRDPLWLAGITVNILGELCGNFVALSYASASVVAPLGAVSLVVNGVLAATVLGEPIRPRHRLGYAYLILGVLVLVLVAPGGGRDSSNSGGGNAAAAAAEPAHALTVDELGEHLRAPAFLAYLAVLVGAGAFLGVRFVRRRLRTAEGHVVLAAILGAFTVLSSQVLSVLLRLSLVDGHAKQFASVLPYLAVAVLASAAVCLEVVKQVAITHYDASLFWPLFFACYNLIGITFSLVLSQELEGRLLAYLPGFVVGLLLLWQGSARIGTPRAPTAAPAETGALGLVNGATDDEGDAAVVVGGAGVPALTRWALPPAAAAVLSVVRQARDRVRAALAPAPPAKVAEP
jgi:uncharacterized membrane protein